jgi:hypothetical protein
MNPSMDPTCAECSAIVNSLRVKSDMINAVEIHNTIDGKGLSTFHMYIEIVRG